MMSFAFTANEYSWFEHRSAWGRYYGNIVDFQGTQGDWRNMTLVLSDFFVVSTFRSVYHGML